MESQEELLLHEMSDIMFAENQLVKALGEMARESKNKEMKTAFRKHQKETKGQIKRLKMAFKALGSESDEVVCHGIVGLVKEKKAMDKEKPSKEIRDVFNRGAAMKTEHYEIASYESMIELADKLGFTDVGELLSQNLAEEVHALETLRRIEA